MAVKQAYALVLGFKNSKKKTCTITIDNVKEDLTQDNITPVMDAILADNIIITSTGDDLVSKVFAKVVAKTETDYQYQ
ncbi:DUF2922 domain-containing protein [Clostridium tarantellae]|uniref:DUF2922 family protein n=1 Tax=Clostridium tarantellae TaxID=39493 RepID=A0A6I1MVJ6_9CLOT|nr:DUF2922 domain-containing protein [Clostridium tarantellae]MPQ44199.1 DUF2922 family protein [Clostridium tarantellae]